LLENWGMLMSSDRYFVPSSTPSQTIHFGGVASAVAGLALSALASSALADGCELKDITKENNATKAVQENFDKLVGCVKELQAQLAKIQNSSGHVTINGTDGSVAGSEGSVEGLAGTYSLENDKFVACPSGSFVSAIQGFKPNGQSPIVQIRYACRSVK
jgi:hypothetical protein